MEVTVDVPDAFTGSDLTWHLDQPAELVESDGQWTVRIRASGDVAHLLSAIRDWVVLRRLDQVVVHVGGQRHLLVPE